MGNLHVTVQITEFPENFSNPQGGQSKEISAGKCHLLDFVWEFPEEIPERFRQDAGNALSRERKNT